jgi:hypothetical protein
MTQRYSLLDVMRWSDAATKSGIISNGERAETNSLANRLAFADDHGNPAFVTRPQRARFEELVRKVLPESATPSLSCAAVRDA